MAQFLCEICKNPIIDITASGTFHYVRAWVKVGSNSTPKQVEKLHLYAHGICVETFSDFKTNAGQNASLFD